jgi:hypothetical protein
MPLRSFPPRFVMLSLSEAMYQLFGRVASLAGLHIACASTLQQPQTPETNERNASGLSSETPPFRLDELKTSLGQPGTAIVVFEDSDYYDTLRMVANPSERVPNSVFVLITEEDLQRIVGFVIENHAIANECWDSMKRAMPKGPRAASCQMISASFLTIDDIEKRSIVAEVMENPLLSGPIG